MSCGRKNNLKIQGKKSKIQIKKSKTRKHRGGSYASDLVMAAAHSPSVMDDYVTDPRVRDGPNADYVGLVDSSQGQRGGSSAYDMTMENLNDSSKTNKYVNGWKVEGDINSLNTYQPSGGKRNSKSHKSNKRNQKSNSKSKNNKSIKRNNKSKRFNRNKKSSRNKNKNRVTKGGASDYMASYYSLDSNVARPNSAWDPPTRDLAGSGAAMGANEGANVSRMGSPLV